MIIRSLENNEFVPVFIDIDFVKYVSISHVTNGVAYINIYLDSEEHITIGINNNDVDNLLQYIENWKNHRYLSTSIGPFRQTEFIEDDTVIESQAITRNI